jgi:hypothetical protein
MRSLDKQTGDVKSFEPTVWVSESKEELSSPLAEIDQTRDRPGQDSPPDGPPSSISQQEDRAGDQGYFRSNQECSGTNTPIEGLYVCGVSAYPGGLVLGGSGYLGANKVAEDLGIQKWWRPTEEMDRYIKTER